jgi:phosphoribosylformylglycinamidine synthase
MKVVVIVTPKPSVFDPQGEAVGKALRGLGIESLESVRIGKHIALEIRGPASDSLRAKVGEVCRDLLSNPVIEDYQVEWPEASRPVAVRLATRRRPLLASLDGEGAKEALDNEDADNSKKSKKKAKKEEKKRKKKKGKNKEKKRAGEGAD